MPKNIVIQELLKKIKEQQIKCSAENLKKLFMLSDEQVEKLIRRNDLEVRLNLLFGIISRWGLDQIFINKLLEIEDLAIFENHLNNELLLDFFRYYTSNIGKNDETSLILAAMYCDTRAVSMLFSLRRLGSIYDELLTATANGLIDTSQIKRLYQFFNEFDKLDLNKPDLIIDLINLVINCDNTELYAEVINRLFSFRIEETIDSIKANRKEILSAISVNANSKEITTLLLKLIDEDHFYYYPRYIEYLIDLITSYGEKYYEEMHIYMKEENNIPDYINWSDIKTATQEDFDIAKKIDYTLISAGKPNDCYANSIYYRIEILKFLNHISLKKHSHLPGSEENTPNLLKYFPTIFEANAKFTPDEVVAFIKEIVAESRIHIETIEFLLDKVTAQKAEKKDANPQINKLRLNKAVLLAKYISQKVAEERNCCNYPSYLNLFKYLLTCPNNSFDKINNTIEANIDLITIEELLRLLEEILKDNYKTAESISTFLNTDNNLTDQDKLDKLIEALEFYESEKNIDISTPISVKSL